MRIIRGLKTMRRVSQFLAAKGKCVGFVPTMGALHEGHLSLIRKARQENDAVIVSVFVNPAQFSMGEDYDKYPRAIKNDAVLAEDAGCDILFHPSPEALYPDGFSCFVHTGRVSEVLCGISRPGHFTGVATICLKLFNIVMPHRVYMGRKDYQQAVIIKRMVRDLNINTDIKVLPTVRESSGLAMSSRNDYLSPRQRSFAATIYKSLKKAAMLIEEGEQNPDRIKAIIRGMLFGRSVAVEYIVIVRPDTLEEIKCIAGSVLIALAVRLGQTRLIDNILVNKR
ncbi:MAG: pantoate--beta-alanine ligase [Candidatus Omnitrophota bacterium]